MTYGYLEIYYHGELIDRRQHDCAYSRNRIIQQWKHRYGRKFYDAVVCYTANEMIYTKDKPVKKRA